MIASPELANHWYVVAGAHDVTTKPVAVTVRDVDYVLWRDADGQLVAAPDRCTHREARLSLGVVGDGCLTCPYHGWAFGTDGRCVAVPSSGPDGPIAPAAHLTTASTAERYGLIWLCPGAPSSQIPHLAVDADPTFSRLNTSVQTWECSATRMIDNMLDVAHCPYTHAGIDFVLLDFLHVHDGGNT